MGVLLVLPLLVCSDVVAATKALTPTSLTPMAAAMMVRATPTSDIQGNEPRRVRDIDMALYRAHWQFSDAPSGCVDPASVNRTLEAATPFSPVRIGVLRAGIE